MANPFAVLGLPQQLDLDPALLEQRYLKLSRECHPDHLHGEGADCVAVLQRAAEVNDAYRALRDRFDRARILVDLLDPAAMARNERLDPDFLMTALEQAEEVADASSDASRNRLQQRIEENLEQTFDAVVQALRARDADAAATALHQSRYHRKALLDLKVEEPA
jgi:Fe-S protein assembly co-chaperone HscB